MEKHISFSVMNESWYLSCGIRLNGIFATFAKVGDSFDLYGKGKSMVDSE